MNKRLAFQRHRFLLDHADPCRLGRSCKAAVNSHRQKFAAAPAHMIGNSAISVLPAGFFAQLHDHACRHRLRPDLRRHGARPRSRPRRRPDRRSAARAHRAAGLRRPDARGGRRGRRHADDRAALRADDPVGAVRAFRLLRLGCQPHRARRAQPKDTAGRADRGNGRACGDLHQRCRRLRADAAGRSRPDVAEARPAALPDRSCRRRQCGFGRDAHRQSAEHSDRTGRRPRFLVLFRPGAAADAGRPRHHLRSGPGDLAACARRCEACDRRRRTAADRPLPDGEGIGRGRRPCRPFPDAAAARAFRARRRRAAARCRGGCRRAP